MIRFDDAEGIAERFLIGLGSDTGVKLKVLRSGTIERDFGWVFFYGPEDDALVVAGNAPFIVDRKTGSIHVTGTALPFEAYLENYARTGTAFPTGVPEHTVVLEGWKPGKPAFAKISLTKAIRAATGKGLAESKGCTDSVLSGEDVALMFATAAEADRFAEKAQELGVEVRREK